jgi:hypothetical protein
MYAATGNPQLAARLLISRSSVGSTGTGSSFTRRLDGFFFTPLSNCISKAVAVAP